MAVRTGVGGLLVRKRCGPRLENVLEELNEDILIKMGSSKDTEPTNQDTTSGPFPVSRNCDYSCMRTHTDLGIPARMHA